MVKYFETHKTAPFYHSSSIFWSYIFLLNKANWRVFVADGGIGAQAFAGELVMFAAPCELKIKGLLKHSWGLWIEPDFQNNFTSSWYNPAKCSQAK